MSIILDCDLMRYRNTGLYHYCLNIGIRVNDLLKSQNAPAMKMYVPPAEANAFGQAGYCITEKKWHKVFKPFLLNCKVWHAPFQSGRIIPDERKHKSAKVLLTIHDLNALHEGKPEDEQIKSIAHTQRLINRSDAIVCISEFTRQDVLKNCDAGNKPLYVIHNGTHKVHAPQLKEHSLKPARPFIFGMGDLNTKKNFHVLLALLEQNPDLDMVLSGRLDEPSYVAAVKQQAIISGIEDRLYITGPVSEEEKAWYLSNCMAFAFPSLAEGFGAPVVEAMKFGKPLFLSHRTSLPEVGGSAAFYFNSFDPESMQRVFKEGMQQYHQTNMSAAIMERGKEFDWQKSAAQYLKVYQSLY